MKKIKNTEVIDSDEIILTENNSIMFGNPENTNGDMLIFGYFKNICGAVEWNGKYGLNNSWFENLDVTKFSKTFFTNVSMIVNTIKKGHRIVCIGSSESCDYWSKLMYHLMEMKYLTGGVSVSNSRKNKILNQMHTFKINLSNKKKNDREKYINTLFNDLKNSKLMFSNIILNPPYKSDLHSKILQNCLNLLSVDGHLSIIEPSTWLINVRDNSPKLYDDIKKKIDGHVESVVIENLNKTFTIANGKQLSIDTPLSITTIDMSKKYDTIDFTCCGEHKYVKSIYDCNLIGDYKTIMSIINKVKSYKKMMKDYRYSSKLGKTYEAYLRYWNYPLYALGSNYGNVVNQYLNKTIAVYRELNFGSFFCSYVDSLYYKNIQNTIPLSQKNTECDCLCGTKEELANWIYNVENNKLFVFLTICTIFDKHNEAKGIVPFMCDRHYTDEEINQIFNFTDDEISLIDSTLEKFSYDSPWFKRYMCGVEKSDN